jgi:hypothetical protein
MLTIDFFLLSKIGLKVFAENLRENGEGNCGVFY